MTHIKSNGTISKSSASSINSPLILVIHETNGALLFNIFTYYREMMICNEADEVIKELCDSLKNKYQNNLKSMKGNDYITNVMK